jgi:two-component system, NtrC family, response regulator HydG
MCAGSALLLEHLPPELAVRENERNGQVETRAGKRKTADMLLSMPNIASEKEVIFSTLQKMSGNKAKAARILGIDRSTLYRKMRRYKLDE